MARKPGLLHHLPIFSGTLERAEKRRARLAADPLKQAQLRDERLWLLALLIIFLLAVSLFLITATGDAVGLVPEIVAPLTMVLGSDITTCFLLVMVLLIVAYIRERLADHWAQNRRLIEELTRKESALKKKDAQLTTWGELSHALIANFDLPRLLDLIVTTAIEVTNADRGSVMLLDPEEDVLTIKAAKGIDQNLMASTRLKLGEGIAGRVAVTGEPLLLSRSNYQSHLNSDRHRDEDISSAISVPLRIEERIVGTLNVNESSRATEFRNEDLRALTLFADQAALALEKAQLYRDSQRQLEKLLSVLDELGRTQAQLVHSEKLASLGVLAGGVAHEINNPLMVILGRTELMLMDDNTDDPVKQNLDTIRTETERIAHIVQGLLTFSRKSRQDKIETVNLNEILERTLMLSEHQLTVGNVRVEKELQPDLPTIQANPGELQQVFMNLIINAHHAMPDGGKLSIRTGGVPDGRLSVEIADTGCGIPPEDINRIFDPFFTTKEEGQGTGLGLSVSRNIIESHGGEIGVQSIINQGTLFRVIVPIVPPTEPSDTSPFSLAGLTDPARAVS
ncbi:MAG: GAF domain-containing protein [Armatimonadota bacterium]|nr:MAG: GAF domain-containing protein [Armatimonadota bacterium]